MAKIKDTVAGVVYARTASGTLHKLRAGDTVPTGVKVRAELLASTPTKGGNREKPAAKSSNSND